VARLSSLVPEILPDPGAWGSFEARLSSYSNRRIRVLIPAAAAACVAVVVYIFLFSQATGRQPVGSLARKIGLVRIKPFAADNWVEAEEKRDIFEGDEISTGPDSSARLEIRDGGSMVLGVNTGVRLVCNNGKAPRVVLLAGKTCTCRGGCRCMEAAGTEFDIHGCQCVLVMEENGPVVYVKSGNMICRKNGRAAQVGAMQKIVLSGENDLLPVGIETPDIFEKAAKLLEASGGNSR
jgi:hypothetical protein